MDISIGDIVVSKAGRDKGVYFVVLSMESEYAYICDGSMRKADKPKKKKLKHLRHVKDSSDFIIQKLKNIGKVTNSELRKELSEYNQTL